MIEVSICTPITRNIYLSKKSEIYRNSIRKSKLNDILNLIRNQKIAMFENNRKNLTSKIQGSYSQTVMKKKMLSHQPEHLNNKSPILFTNVKPTFANLEKNLDLIFIGEFCFSKKNLIGKGSFAKVYKGYHTKDPNKTVAIKEILDDFSSKTFIDEIYITKSIKSENVVEVYDSFINSNERKCFLFLEFCEGGSLEKLKGKKLSLEDLRKLFQQIMRGMKALYSHRIIHRDLKLENILLKGSTVKISDFGFAKHLGNYSQVQSVKCGTPSTMAPEILFGNGNYSSYSNKCDIWSIGIIFHELAYGCHPFALNIRYLEQGKRVQVKNRILEVEDFLNKCLVLDPNKRMSWESAFLHELIQAKEKEISFKPSPIEKPDTIPSVHYFGSNNHPRKYMQGVPKIDSIQKETPFKLIKNVKKRKEINLPFDIKIDHREIRRVAKIIIIFGMIFLLARIFKLN